MYALLILSFLTGFLGSDIEEGYCDKETGCGTEDRGKPITFRPSVFPTNLSHYPVLHDKIYLIGANEIPQVLWWHDNIYPHSKDQKEVSCSLGKCSVTADRKELKNHLTRGIIQYGTSFSIDDLPLPRLPHHEWALFHEESPKNKWLLSTDAGISIFNHTATFRRESDYPLSTQFMKNVDSWFGGKYFVETEEKNRYQKVESLAPVVFVQRDCHPPSDRDTYVKELMKYIKVDSYGPCLNNKKLPEDIDGFHRLSSESYYHFLAKYKFQIAIENALCSDYMTEKVFRPLEIGSVPIYLGSERIRDFMPSMKSVVLISDFESPKHLAEYLLVLNSNDTLYNEYLHHRDTGLISNPEYYKSIERQPWKVGKYEMVNFGHFMFAGFSCYVCDRLHERNNRLKEHLTDPNVSPLKNRIANSSHLGCPFTQPGIVKSSSYRDFFSNVQKTADSIIKMLQANETDLR